MLWSYSVEFDEFPDEVDLSWKTKSEISQQKK